MFLVTIVTKKTKVRVLGLEQELEMNFADGMIGVCPVFARKEDALEYASGKEELVIEVNPV